MVLVILREVLKSNWSMQMADTSLQNNLLGCINTNFSKWHPLIECFCDAAPHVSPKIPSGVQLGRDLMTAKGHGIWFTSVLHSSCHSVTPPCHVDGRIVILDETGPIRTEVFHRRINLDWFAVTPSLWGDNWAQTMSGIMSPQHNKNRRTSSLWG